MAELNQVMGRGTAGTEPRDTSRKVLRVASWVVQIFAAAMFLMAGTSKLRGVPQMVELFETIGIGQWFRYLTGGLEVAGAVMLLVPRLAAFGAVLLVAVMVGAVATHLFVIGGNPTMAIVLLVASAFVAWVRRDELAAVLRRGGR